MKKTLVLLVLSLAMTPACKKLTKKPSKRALSGDSAIGTDPDALDDVLELKGFDCASIENEPPRAATLWQLSPIEYENTMNDLLSLEFSWSETLPGGSSIATIPADSGAYDGASYTILVQNAVRASLMFADRFDVLSGEFGAWPDHSLAATTENFVALHKFSPEIDGTLDPAWTRYAQQDLSQQVIGSGTAEDLSARWRYKKQSDALYVFMTVTDDINLPLPGNPVFDQDSIEIFLDTRGRTQGEHEASTHSIFISSDGRTQPANLQDQIEAAILRSGTQTLYEIKIPWQAVGVAQEPEEISIDVQANDADDTNGRDRKVAWNSTTDTSFQVRDSFKLLRSNITNITDQNRINQPCSNRDACLEAFIRSFGLRAYRRSLEETEVASILAANRTKPDATAITDIIRTMLVSVHFLYKVELPKSGKAGISEISDYSLASKISYFLWRSMPNKSLFAAAQSGSLANMTDAAFTELWESYRSIYGVGGFLQNLFGIQSIADVSRSPEAYPQFDEELGNAIDISTQLFFKHIIYDAPRSVKSLYDSREVFVNNKLQDIYGLSSNSDAWQLINTGEKRAGVLTQAGFLASHAKTSNSDPIGRGVAIVEDVICSPFTDPPSDFADDQGVEFDPTKTPRQNAEKVTQIPGCIGCHQIIDPIGYALDGFDALGAKRTTLGGMPIDTTGFVPGDGLGKVGDGVDMSLKIAASPKAHMCIAEKVLGSANGLNLKPDQYGCSMQVGLDAMRASDFDLKATIKALLLSKASNVRLFGE